MVTFVNAYIIVSGERKFLLSQRPSPPEFPVFSSEALTIICIRGKIKDVRFYYTAPSYFDYSKLAYKDIYNSLTWNNLKEENLKVGA